MKCPACEEGNIIKVRFKKSGESASLCDQCNALWFLGEDINPIRMHNFRSFANDLEIEHALNIHDEKDQDHSPIGYKSYE